MLLPKPVRRLLFLLIFLFAGYQAYEYLKIHTQQQVIILKAFSKAVTYNDLQSGSNHSLEDASLAPFRNRAKRNEGIPGQIRFVWHNIQDLRPSQDNSMLVVTVRQIIRYDPPGANTLWGADTIYNTQRFILVADRSTWKVKSYQDSFFTPGIDG